MLPLLRPSVLHQVSELRSEFESAKPFRHVVVDNFLTDDFCGALCREFPRFDTVHAKNEAGEIGGKAVVGKLPQIGPAYAQFDKLIRSKELLSLIGEISGIPSLLYDPDYFGGGTHENLNGQALDIHIDFNYHPNTHTHRRLNLIVFLNPEWREEWGGCLELHHNPWAEASEDFTISVVPSLNRCVLFETTESSWHGFRAIDLPPDRAGISRRSIAVYFYTNERPPEETAPSHSTVYVPQRMPEHLQPGYTLTEADCYALQVLLKRRDDQIRFLYEQEKEMRAVFESRSFQLARLIAAPLRMLKSVR